MTTRIHTGLLVAVALAGVFAMTGCAAQNAGSDTATETTTSAEATVEFNAADEMFVTMMIPHHEQAIEMADIVLAKSGVAQEVTDLAEQIKAAQGPEIETMHGWLEAWGVEYVENTAHMGHGDGMMTTEDMAALEDADGQDAGHLFLEQMIVHHEGAVEMAEALDGTGQNPDVAALAEQVIVDQTAEITLMQDMLEHL